jgi:hypothetical protein
MSNDIPSTDVIRHWVGWADDDYSTERVAQFEAWLDVELAKERDRVIASLRNAFGEEYYKTGVTGKIVRIIEGEI